jgi:hypothetical protein
MKAAAIKNNSNQKLTAVKFNQQKHNSNYSSHFIINNSKGVFMKTLTKHLFLVLTLLVFSVACNSQPGLTDIALDETLEKKSGVTALSQLNNETAIPAFFNYSVIGGEEVTLNGSPISVKESTNPFLNANVHSNQSVILNGTRIAVEGFITFNEKLAIDGDKITIEPNYNPNSRTAYYKVPDIEIPSIEVQKYKSLADVVYDGDTKLNGKINLGTNALPSVIYVAGNLYMDNVTFIGYGVVLAEKEVEIISDVKSSTLDQDYTKVLIVAGDKFILNNSNTTLHAAVYAKNEINIIAGKVLIDGSLASLSKNTLNGSGIDVRFKLVHPNLSTLIFSEN